MKIVVPDGHTENPGDLSWGALGELAGIPVHVVNPFAARTVPAEFMRTDRNTARRLCGVRAVRVFGKVIRSGDTGRRGRPGSGRRAAEGEGAPGV